MLEIIIQVVPERDGQSGQFDAGAGQRPAQWIEQPPADGHVPLGQLEKQIGSRDRFENDLRSRPPPTLNPLRGIARGGSNHQATAARGEAIQIDSGHVGCVELKTPLGIGFGSQRPGPLRGQHSLLVVKSLERRHKYPRAGQWLALQVGHSPAEMAGELRIVEVAIGPLAFDLGLCRRSDGGHGRNGDPRRPRNRTDDKRQQAASLADIDCHRA